MNLLALRAEVEAKLGAEAVEMIIEFVLSSSPILWGDAQADDFVQTNVLMVLYKDLIFQGYSGVLKRLNLPTKISQSSFQHNARVIRPLFKKWAKTKIVLGDASHWNAAARRMSFPGELKNVTLWIDSSDFKIQCPRGAGRKNPYYSYKNHGLSRRFMMICDAKGRIRKIWGGYSPKVYDGHWLEINKDWIEENLAGASVIGDCHFAMGKRMFNQVKFFVPHATPAKAKVPDGEGLVKLTKEQEKWNARVAHIRSRIERPFGWMKTTFRCLEKPWAEDPNAQDYVVWLAAAVLNVKRNL